MNIHNNILNDNNNILNDNNNILNDLENDLLILESKFKNNINIIDNNLINNNYPKKITKEQRKELINYKKSKGQFFTENIILKEKLFSFIKNKPKLILEPTVGQGDLVKYVSQKNNKIKFDMFEIDQTINFLQGIDKSKIIFGDFMKQKIDKLYPTIIGNPPYLKTNKGNLYVLITEKCFNLLQDKGELIFIVPSDFFKLTSAAKLLNNMMEQGTFTDIYHPNDEKLFEFANIDVVIYRYCKDNSLPKKVMYNQSSKFIVNSNGLITFQDNNNIQNKTISDYFNVFVGIVSGLDSVFKNEQLGNINVLVDEKKFEKFIFIEKYPSDNQNINDYLLQNKKSLKDRKIKKFNDNNWFEWGAPRNISSIRNFLGKDCIYVNNLTRKQNIAFIGKVSYFGGTLIMMLPKPDIQIDLSKVAGFINSESFKNNFKFSNRFKIGHKQLCDSFIDISKL